MSVKSRIQQKIAVIGLGTFGSSLAKELTKAGIQVLAIDTNIETIDEISEFVDHAVCMDAKDRAALEQNGIYRVDAAAVCIGESFQECAMVTLGLLEMKIPRVLARAHGDSEAIILKRMGVQDVLFVEQEMGKHWATLLARPGVIEDFEVAKNYSIVRIAPDPEWIGKSLIDLKLPLNHGFTVLGCYTEDRFELIRGADQMVSPEKELLIISHHQDLDRYFAKKAQ